MYRQSEFARLGHGAVRALGLPNRLYFRILGHIATSRIQVVSRTKVNRGTEVAHCVTRQDPNIDRTQCEQGTSTSSDQRWAIKVEVLLRLRSVPINARLNHAIPRPVCRVACQLGPGVNSPGGIYFWNPLPQKLSASSFVQRTFLADFQSGDPAVEETQCSHYRHNLGQKHGDIILSDLRLRLR